MMDKKTLARRLKALSDPTRLSILDVLMEGVQCNCEISERLGLSLSLVSHHLRTLRQADLVLAERDSDDARWIYYSASRDVLEQLGQVMNHLLDINRIQPRVPSCGPKRCDPC